MEAVGGVEGHFDDFDVVDLGAYAVHAVGWGAGEDFVFAWYAEASEESIDGFVRAYAAEHVFWEEGLGGVVVGVSEVAEKLLELNLVTVMVRLGFSRWNALNWTHGSG